MSSRKCADRFIERRAEHFHAGANARIVAVGMHVPAGVLHGDKAAAGLDEAAGHEKLLAQGRGLKELFADAEAARVVAVDRPRVFLGNVERVARAADDHVERLQLEAIEPLQVAAGVDRALDVVELSQEQLAVAQAIGRDGETQVVQELAAAGRIERGKGQAQFAGVRAGGDAAALHQILAIDFIRRDEAIGRQTARFVVRRHGGGHRPSPCSGRFCRRRWDRSHRSACGRWLWDGCCCRA